MEHGVIKRKEKRNKGRRETNEKRKGAKEEMTWPGDVFHVNVTAT
jgi:hypothetical protein